MLAQGNAKPKVACLGPEGTYTEAARHQLLGSYLKSMEANFLPYNATVVQKVEAGDYDIGIVPVENAIEGDVVEVLRELKHTKETNILGETILGIQHMLIGQPEARLEEIKEVHSHPQALAQCRAYLLTHCPKAIQKNASSTAAAVELVKENSRVAAIASRRAAEISNLPILAEDIGDIKGNSTRFILLGRGETLSTGQDSTTLIFVPREDRPGILADCLTVLKLYDINLTKLDSRPTGKMREYEMWLTLDGHIQDSNVSQALNLLDTRYCASLRVLGSYRKAIIPQGVKDPGVINGQ